jgi:hypothetical protein
MTKNFGTLDSNAVQEDIRVLRQDGSTETYTCGPTSCGYKGDTYCAECGYGAGER